MTNSQEPSFFQRLFVGILFLYALALIIYLALRWTLQPDWPLYLLAHNAAFYLFLPVIIGALLAMLLRAPRVTGLYWMLLCIGLVWFTPRLLPPLSPSAQLGTPLKIVTFNVYPYNTQLEAVDDWLLAQDADVVLVQELAGELPDVADAYAYHEAISDTGTSAVFSRYPIMLNETIDLVNTPQQRLLLDIDGEQVVVYNIHLYMPLSEDESPPLLLRYDENRRNEQINILLTRIAQENLPVIVAGDFNMSEFSPIYTRLDARLNDAFRDAAWGLGQTWPAGEFEDLDFTLPPLFRLDYVWYTDDIQAIDAEVGRQLGSDHLPLTVNLDIAP